ncbi:MAG: prepilin-type N-terminal cleavage/methylation domain-containing protein [Deltaproteobacteria bacterium]|nr:prepilin-type N-terminal cleavage/methylation domain-containing protein [Deltaproteobacteria bacterium]
MNSNYKLFGVQKTERGFTLLEVVIALAILGLGLGVLLHAQATSLAAAGRVRGLTIATLLARSKMIDIEQDLLDEGFTLGTVEKEGDFKEEGHPDFKWKYQISEVKIDLDLLRKFTGDSQEDNENNNTAGNYSSLAMSLEGPLEVLTKQASESIRLVDLKITWPNGQYTDSTKISAIVTREDLGISTQQSNTTK